MRFSSAIQLAVIALLGLAPLLPVKAGDRWQAASADHRSTLLELYTSEGCNSCPPADRWLRGLPAIGYPPTQVVPLGFHVDYWDRLGWRDRFADPSHTQRQRERASQAGSEVFTPQFLVNGEVVFNTRQILERIRRSVLEPATVRLTLDVRRAAGGLSVQPRVIALGGESLDNRDLYIAVYENDLSSEVTAGENAGRRLQHDYVVRHLHGPTPVGAASPAALRLALDPDWNPARLGVAAFVQDRSSGRVLQALDLRLVGLRP